ncbi:MAG TPA: DUF2809 domain-containing protein [Anaerolineae bacterium]|nr:DUF2809 domain-containing protein [Anaerolineae bacterium]
MPSKTKHLLIAIALFIVEILIATVFSHIKFVRAYLGDFLVVMLLYHIVKIFYDVAPLTLAALVFSVACGVEVSQYFHLADIWGLPRGSLLSILIGTDFSWIDILMYFLGSLTAYLADSHLIPQKKR